MFTFWSSSLLMCLEDSMKCPNSLDACTPIEDLNGIQSSGFGLYFAVSCVSLGRDREEDLPPHDSFHMWPQQPVLYQSKSRGLEFLLVSHVGARSQGIECFPRPQAGSWMGSRAARIEPAPKWHPSMFKVRTLGTRPTCRTVILSLKYVNLNIYMLCRMGTLTFLLKS